MPKKLKLLLIGVFHMRGFLARTGAVVDTPGR